MELVQNSDTAQTMQPAPAAPLRDRLRAIASPPDLGRYDHLSDAESAYLRWLGGMAGQLIQERCRSALHRVSLASYLAAGIPLAATTLGLEVPPAGIDRALDQPLAGLLAISRVMTPGEGIQSAEDADTWADNAWAWMLPVADWAGLCGRDLEDAFSWCLLVELLRVEQMSSSPPAFDLVRTWAALIARQYVSGAIAADWADRGRP